MAYLRQRITDCSRHRTSIWSRLSTMEETRPQADFVIEAPNRGIQLVVEAKNIVAPSPDWLLRLLRNLFVHAAIPRSEYFLLVLRDHLYLWRRPDPEKPAPPDFV